MCTLNVCSLPNLGTIFWLKQSIWLKRTETHANTRQYDWTHYLAKCHLTMANRSILLSKVSYYFSCCSLIKEAVARAYPSSSVHYSASVSLAGLNCRRWLHVIASPEGSLERVETVKHRHFETLTCYPTLLKQYKMEPRSSRVSFGRQPHIRPWHNRRKQRLWSNLCHRYFDSLERQKHSLLRWTVIVSGT